METEEVGIRELRANLAGYLERGKPLTITRNGEPLGFYFPAARREAMKSFDAIVASWGATEEELIAEYKEIRRADREKRRSAKRPGCRVRGWWLTPIF